MTILTTSEPASTGAVGLPLLTAIFASNAVHDDATRGWLITHLQDIGALLYVLVQLCTLILLLRYLLRGMPGRPGEPSLYERAHRFCKIAARMWAQTRHPWTEDDRP